jgi:endonuclease I
MVFNFRSILLVLVAGLARADEFSPPTNHYGASLGLTGSSLDTALRAIVGGHSVRAYDQLRQDLALTDRDWNFPPSTPSAVTNILLIYSNGWSGASRSGVWDSGVTWNREHVWPDSRGIGQPDSGADFSDMHHLRAANPSANSSRGNSYFDVGGNIAPVIQSPLAYTQRLSEIPISKLMKSLFSRNRENGLNVKIELPFTKTSLFTTT